MSKNKLSLIMMTLLTASALGGAVFAHAQEVEVDENMVAAENLLSMLSERESAVTSLFEQIVGEGGEVPEDAAEALLEAQELHAEAQGLYDEGSYEESLEKATDALNKYGKAITEATPEEPEDPEEPETMTTEEQEETEKMVGLFTAIEKARKRITNLDEIANKLIEQGIDVSEAKAKLFDAGLILDSILLEDIEGAEEQLFEANSLIGEATGMLKSNGEPIKEEKIELFRTQAMHHMEQLNIKMLRFLDKFGSSEEDSLLMQAKYGEISKGLSAIDTKDGLKAAVTQLKWLEKEKRNVGKGTEVEELLGEDTFESIDDQTKMESKLEYYWEIVNAMDDEDPVRAEVLVFLSQVEDLLVGAETALVEGDEDLADEKTEEAEEILEIIDDLVGSSGKGKGKGSKQNNATKGAKSNGNGHNKDDEPIEETIEGQEPEDPESDTD